jgi:hypothetical protein
MKKLFLTFLIVCFTLNNKNKVSLATDENYSQPAGHTGVYINLKNVWALKCNIYTSEIYENNKLGWYTAWPMIVDYNSGKFIQIGYIISPKENINKPIFYVAWSDNGKQINLKYLPNKYSVGNALLNNGKHEYALSLNIDGSANIQIDGLKYLDTYDEKIRVGITKGTGEFFSEGSNIGINISTKFENCFYKLRNNNRWIGINEYPKYLLYYVSEGTEIKNLGNNSFEIKGKIKAIKKGKFLKKLE